VTNFFENDTQRLMVVGARPGSLGEAIAWYARAMGLKVVTAGVTDEEISLNVESSESISSTIGGILPDHVVCTVGVNVQNDRYSMDVNYLGVIDVLDEWLTHSLGGQFVAISSNSAHIARTASRAYCASKAALSMGIRCTARENACRDGLVYAWEFGLLEGTPMTEAVAARLPRGTVLTRMPGHPNGQSVTGAARLVVDTLRVGTTALNGCTLRVDGGDQ
jgi:NAD(P)-dependent dehydrogenase (short-subunit alcohol dehydrogenase family)